ncbi:MAG: DNA adenine methylase [Hyphomicrobium sp.]|uniref:DNA adenine methylase n=1 Tax=Hyphomicrobium sp. TaxID=82 RepID=UPI003D110C2A
MTDLAQFAGRGPTRPVLRYHGGKWRLAPWIIEHFPPHRVYVEPYGGAASVLLRKPRARGEVYNDLWNRVVDVFRVLRDPVRARALKRLLALTPFAREEFRSAAPDAFDTDDIVERARLTIMRAYLGHGSNSPNEFMSTGFRSNSMRSNTTPATEWMHYPDCIDAFVERLRGVVIESKPAAEVMAGFDAADTLHYLDPPYLPETRSPGNPYCTKHMYAHEMTDRDHRALAKVLHGLKGMIVLSGYPSPLYDRLYRDWRRVEITALADGALERTECLWINPAAIAAGATKQLSMFDEPGAVASGQPKRPARERSTHA